MKLQQEFFVVVVATVVIICGAHLSHNQVSAFNASSSFEQTPVNQSPARALVRRALLVGINIYQPVTTAAPTKATTVEEKAGSSAPQRGKTRDSWYNLDGPTNDVDELREILIARYDFKPENIHVIKDSAATRERILAELGKYFISEAAPGDVCLFFYAGHGSQVFNSKSREADKKDESLVPADSSQGALDIRDKELARLFNKSLDKGVLLTAIFDSCHSGSIARGYPRPEKLRWLEPDLRDVADPPDPGKTPEQRGALVFSATLDNQPAVEKRDDQGVDHGIFSTALLKTLRSAPLNEPAERVYLRVKALMQTEGLAQEPVLAGSEERRHKSLFGADAAGASGRTTVAVLRVAGNGELELQGGKAVGLAEDCELKKIGKPTEKTLRIQVTRIAGLNRCQARVIEGDAKSVQVGDLFEVDRWVAPYEAILRVWMPPATLPLAELLHTAQGLSMLRTSARVEWVDDPTEVSQAKAPLYVITWEGSEWRLFLSKGRAEKLGKNPTAKMILDKLPASGTIKPRLFLHIPPSMELAKEVKLGDGTPNDSIKVVASPEQADYLLMGRTQGRVIEYAWELPNITKDQGSNLPLLTRTDWVAVSEGPVTVTNAARGLEGMILRTGRVKAWLQIEAPPDSNPFPYHLALKNTKTGAIKTSGKTVEKEEYSLMLIADRDQLAKGPVVPRYVYVLTIDSFGTGQLLVPATEGAEHRVPFEVAGKEKGKVPTEVQLSGIEVGEPFGVDTFILITSIDAIPNAANALNFGGARTRGQLNGEGLSPIARLLYQTGSATRGTRVANPTGWSIQRLSMKSEPRPQK